LRSLSAAFIAVLEAEYAPDLITLLTINTPTPIRRAWWWRDVTFGGVTYTADGFAHSEVVQDIEGRPPAMTLEMQNIERDDGTNLEWSTLLAAGDINGTEVQMRVVSESLLSDADAVISETDWTISGWQLAPRGVVFKLGAPIDALSITVPTRPLASPTCWWKYKQGACTSTSALESCAHTYGDCSKRYPKGEPLRIGPSSPLLTVGHRR